jgi:hypothetical protein
MPLIIITLTLAVVLGRLAPRRIALTLTATAATVTLFAHIWATVDGKGQDPWRTALVGAASAAVAHLRWGSCKRRLCWWACQDLNLGPHPYQLNAGNRCAHRRSRRSRPTVGAKVMRSIGALVCVLLFHLTL